MTSNIKTTRPASKNAAKNRPRTDAGYTLLEMLVVMGILAVLTAVATPQVMGYFGKAKAQSAQLQVQNIGTALELYYMDNGTYPDTETGLKALVDAPSDAPNWNGPYLKQSRSLLDPWGHPYQYVYPDEHNQFRVFSLGPGGAKGTNVASSNGDGARAETIH